MKESLFSIDAQLETIVGEIIENGGELTPELEEQLAITEDNLNQKLDDYRKAYTIISSRAAECKAEKQRIDVLQKSRERAANRLKDAMLEAVMKWGQTTKSGTKAIELSTSKLSTRKSTVCNVDSNLVQILIDSVLDRFDELWLADMLDVNAEETTNLDPKAFLATVNANFEAENPEYAAGMKGLSGNLFTIEDLEATKVKFEIELPLIELCKKINYDVVTTFFNHEHQAVCSIASSTSDYKQYISSRETSLQVAALCENYSLTIK